MKKKETKKIEDVMKYTTAEKLILCQREPREDVYLLGDEYTMSRFMRNQGKQIDLNDLEVFWNKKWESFDDQWTKEIQLYRFLYYDFKIFYHSFEQLRFNKVDALENHSYDTRFSEIGLYSLYNQGKKCIDLVKKLELTSLLRDEDRNFMRKFAETRNKFFEHNFNPDNYEYYFDPNLFKLLDSSSFLEIGVHELEKYGEHKYEVYIDYYEDYYRLEEIFAKIIRKF